MKQPVRRLAVRICGQAVYRRETWAAYKTCGDDEDWTPDMHGGGPSIGRSD